MQKQNSRNYDSTSLNVKPSRFGSHAGFPSLTSDLRESDGRGILSSCSAGLVQRADCCSSHLMDKESRWLERIRCKKFAGRLKIRNSPNPPWKIETIQLHGKHIIFSAILRHAHCRQLQNKSQKRKTKNRSIATPSPYHQSFVEAWGFMSSKSRQQKPSHMSFRCFLMGQSSWPGGQKIIKIRWSQIPLLSHTGQTDYF